MWEFVLWQRYSRKEDEDEEEKGKKREKETGMKIGKKLEEKSLPVYLLILSGYWLLEDKKLWRLEWWIFV